SWRRAIEIEEVVGGIIADVDVGLAVAVDVHDQDAEAFAIVAKSGLLAYVAKGAVSVVAEQVMRQGVERLRRAHVAAGAVIAVGGMVLLETPVHVLADVEIGIAVSIEVGPGGAGSPKAPRQAGFFGHVHELSSALAVVLVVKQGHPMPASDQ